MLSFMMLYDMVKYLHNLVEIYVLMFQASRPFRREVENVKLYAPDNDNNDDNNKNDDKL